MQSVSRMSPTSAGLARVKCLASSGAVTSSFTVARAVLTALTRSDSVFGQELNQSSQRGGRFFRAHRLSHLPGDR
jgi:hypothetical protein